MTSWFTLLAVLLPLVSALPHVNERRAQTICDQQYASISSSPYTLFTNLWGESGATGWQCSTLDSVNNDVVEWSTSYAWYNKSNTGITSFSNIQLDTGVNQQLSAISSMPSRWDWSQDTTSSVVADVTYDFFTSYTSGGSNANEVMVWLANLQSGPIAEYNSEGQPVPLVSNININGNNWNLYYGSNAYNPVYSFLPSDGNTINSWEGDMYEFFTYLIQNGKIDSSQYLKTAQAGTEVTSGTATFETDAYSLSVN